MSKKSILRQMITACIFAVVGLGFLIPSLAQAKWVCIKTGTVSVNCQATPESLGVGFIIAMTLFGVAGIFALIAWIGALVRTIKMRDWVWFVLLIACSGIATLVYAIVWPEKPQATGLYPPPSSAIPIPPPGRTPTPVG